MHSPFFKAKVALEVVKGGETLTQLANAGNCGRKVYSNPRSSKCTVYPPVPCTIDGAGVAMSSLFSESFLVQRQRQFHQPPNCSIPHPQNLRSNP